MPRLVITRPNGDTEYAELTSDKSLAGDNRLIVQKDGTDYWAKLDKEVSTHMYVIKPNGEKYYVQKEVAFKWKYVVDDAHPVDGFAIPKDGKYEVKLQRWFEEEGPWGKNEIKTQEVVFRKNATPTKERKNFISITSRDGEKIRLSYEGIIPPALVLQITGGYQRIEFGDIFISIEYIGDA